MQIRRVQFRKPLGGLAACRGISLSPFPGPEHDRTRSHERQHLSSSEMLGPHEHNGKRKEKARGQL